MQQRAAKIGMNRTGIQLAPEGAQAMLEAVREFQGEAGPPALDAPAIGRLRGEVIPGAVFAMGLGKERKVEGGLASEDVAAGPGKRRLECAGRLESWILQQEVQKIAGPRYGMVSFVAHGSSALTIDDIGNPLTQCTRPSAGLVHAARRTWYHRALQQVSRGDRAVATRDREQHAIDGELSELERRDPNR